jgi:hypothetical protein
METLLEKSLNKHDFPEKERQALAKEGEAMKDGSFPIRNGQDLKDAIAVSAGQKTLLLRSVGLRNVPRNSGRNRSYLKTGNNSRVFFGKLFDDSRFCNIFAVSN